MTHQITPSSGKRVARPAIDLNVRGYKPGDRVLFIGSMGPVVGRIVKDFGNTMHIEGVAVQVTAIKGRVPDEVDGTALETALRDAAKRRDAARALATRSYEQEEAMLLKEHGVR